MDTLCKFGAWTIGLVVLVAGGCARDRACARTHLCADACVLVGGGDDRAGESVCAGRYACITACMHQQVHAQYVPCNSALLPRRVCCNQLCAMPAQHVEAPEQARGKLPPKKNYCDKQVSSWRHISCHTDKNRYYT